MGERYESVVDRIGAFNLATERLAKGRADEMLCVDVSRPMCWLRLARTVENYDVELNGAAVPEDRRDMLAERGFRPRGDVYARPVSKAERSWNVASELEDLLTEIYDLPAGAAVEVEISER